MKRPLALITGVAGFAGSFLAEDLLEAGYRVAGTLLGNESTENVDAIKHDLIFHKLDILNESATRRLIERLKPDYIFHLAAQASVGRSFDEERLTYRINLDGTLNILAASVTCKNLKKLVFVTSSDTYGIIKPAGKLVNESQPLNPVSPYGISKAAAEHACIYYSRRHGLPVTVARSFNHAGPRQNRDFVIPSFASQIASIEAGWQKPVLKVGNLTARRDLSDVRDIVRGYRQLAERGKTGESYQLCTGRAVSIQRVLDILLDLSRVKIRVTIDKKRLRKNDIPVLRGSNRKAAKALGFVNRYKLRTTLSDTLDFWRSRTPAKG